MKIDFGSKVVDVPTVQVGGDEIRFFHFTQKQNMVGILENGIVPNIGENSNGIEKNNKVFFSESPKYMLKCVDVWLKWMLGKNYVEQATAGIDIESQNKEWNQRRKEAIENWAGFYDFSKIASEKNKNLTFEQAYDDFSSRIFLSLELDPQSDFSYDAKDDPKIAAINNPSRKKQFDYVYGKLDNPDGLEKWNLHTTKAISPDKIKLILDKNEKASALKIIQHYYEENKTDEFCDEEFYLLDEWMEFIKEKQNNDNHVKQ